MLTYEKNLTTGVTREYAYLNNQIIGWQETDNTGNSVKRYAATDLLGSVTTVTDESGTVLWSGEYTAFGNVAYGSGDVLYDGMYTGKDIDSETGLTYHWNRWRSEDGSSFISEDPARDGSNWYGYCGNNPISFTDPTGLVMDYANGGSGTYYGSEEDRPVNDSRVTPDEGPEQGPTDLTTNKPQINYKNFFGFLKTCIENSIAPGSNAMSTTWELFMFPQPHLQGLLQAELDAYLGFYIEGKSSKSCKTVSLILHYAVLGYSPDFFMEKLKEASEEWKGKNYTDIDGSPLEFEKMSFVLSEKLGMSKHLEYVWTKDKERLNLSPMAFLSSNYQMGIERWANNKGSHYTAVIKGQNPLSKILVFDSMSRDRYPRSSYSIKYIEPLIWKEN